MNSASNQFTLIGLPSTGKTSFLAALWYLVQHSQVEHHLTLERMEGDSRHLNEISNLWAKYEVVPRTPTGTERTVTMVLRNKITNQRITLNFPDLSGESFTSQWVDRQFTTGYDKILRESSGGILFISPLNYRKPVRIDMAAPLIQEMGKQDGHEGDDDTTVAWEPSQAPTQVQLVELLQFIADREYFRPPFRLALIISAWDGELANQDVTPIQWLAGELPLLFQFLESNNRLFEYTVYAHKAVTTTKWKTGSSLIQ